MKINKNITLILIIYLISIIFILSFHIYCYSQNTIRVFGENVNLREEPNINSKIITKITNGHPISIIKVSNKKEIIDGKEGTWVYIDSHQSPTARKESFKGWIFDYYLGYSYKFSKINKCQFKPLYYCDETEHACFKYIFKTDGSFILFIESTWYWGKNDTGIIKWCSANGGKWDKNKKLCLITGNIYQYSNILWLKRNDMKNGGHSYILLKSDGSMCPYVFPEFECN